MYRLIPLPTASGTPPSQPGLARSLGAAVALALLGAAGALVAGYYLPATAARSYWFVSRSSGVVAYLLVTLSVVWGLVQSGRLFRATVPPLLALGTHSFLSWFGLALAGLHALVLTGDQYIKMDVAQVLTPFLAPYRPVPVGLGVLGFYGMLLLTLSFYARNHIGQRQFRLLHYGSFGIFVLVTLHGLLAGTDNGALWWLYPASLTAVLVLVVLRIHGAGRDRAQRPRARSSPRGL
jgi:hypothetical protein